MESLPSEIHLLFLEACGSLGFLPGPKTLLALSSTSKHFRTLYTSHEHQLLARAFEERGYILPYARACVICEEESPRFPSLSAGEVEGLFAGVFAPLGEDVEGDKKAYKFFLTLYSLAKYLAPYVADLTPLYNPSLPIYESPLSLTRMPLTGSPSLSLLRHLEPWFLSRVRNAFSVVRDEEVLEVEIGLVKRLAGRERGAWYASAYTVGMGWVKNSVRERWVERESHIEIGDWLVHTTEFAGEGQEVQEVVIDALVNYTTCRQLWRYFEPEEDILIGVIQALERSLEIRGRALRASNGGALTAQDAETMEWVGSLRNALVERREHPFKEHIFLYNRDGTMKSQEEINEQYR